MGLEPSVVATIAAVVPISEDSVQVIYKTPDGTLKDRLLGRVDEENISIAVAERPWSFDGDGEAFKLQVIDHLKASQDHPLTQQLYVRRDDSWVPEDVV